MNDNEKELPQPTPTPPKPNHDNQPVAESVVCQKKNGETTTTHKQYPVFNGKTARTFIWCIVCNTAFAAGFLVGFYFAVAMGTDWWALSIMSVFAASVITANIYLAFSLISKKLPPIKFPFKSSAPTKD